MGRSNNFEPSDEKIDLETVKSHGFTTEEYRTLIDLIKREPTITELGVVSAMWNEHCSYKSTKKWLRTLPTTGAKVICGPGENAGIIDIDDGDALVFKIESHNHPSYIDPFQGSATVSYTHLTLPTKRIV